jgi:hypothetical protein
MPGPPYGPSLLESSPLSLSLSLSLSIYLDKGRVSKNPESIIWRKIAKLSDSCMYESFLIKVISLSLSLPLEALITDSDHHLHGSMHDDFFRNSLNCISIYAEHQALLLQFILSMPCVTREFLSSSILISSESYMFFFKKIVVNP